MNADSSAWLEYFADGPNPSFFAEPIFPVCHVHFDLSQHGSDLFWLVLPDRHLQLPPS